MVANFTNQQTRGHLQEPECRQLTLDSRVSVEREDTLRKPIAFISCQAKPLPFPLTFLFLGEWDAQPQFFPLMKLWKSNKSGGSNFQCCGSCPDFLESLKTRQNGTQHEPPSPCDINRRHCVSFHLCGKNSFHHRDSDLDTQIHNCLLPGNTGENFVHNLSHHCSIPPRLPLPLRIPLNKSKDSYHPN